MSTKEINFPNMELQGFWFLPTDPAHRVAGTLEFSASKTPTLKTIGCLLKPTEGSSKKEVIEQAFTPLEIPIILGELARGGSPGEKITLYRNVLHPEGISSGIGTSKCSSNFIIKGWHLNSENEICFNNLSVHFAHLEQWLRINNLNIYAIPNSDKNEIERIHVDYAPLKEDFLCKAGKFDFYIKDKPVDSMATQIALASLFCQHVNNITLSENKSFLLRTTNNCTLEEYVEVISKIQAFLVFALGQPTCITRMEAQISVREKKYKTESDVDDFNKFLEEPRETLYRNEYFSIYEGEGSRLIEEEVDVEKTLSIFFGASSANSIKDFDENKVLFYFSSVSEDFGKVFSSWCENAKKIQPVIDLYLGMFYLPEIYSVDKFLNLAQASEALHRMLYGGRYMEPKDYTDTVCASLLEAIDSSTKEFDLSEEFSSSLKNRLSYLYEFSLRKRLKELIRENKECLPEGFLNSRKLRENFVEAVVYIRNALTHLDQNTDIEAIISPQELNRLSKHLETLFRACLMNAFNVSPEAIKQMLHRALSR